MSSQSIAIQSYTIKAPSEMVGSFSVSSQSTDHLLTLNLDPIHERNIDSRNRKIWFISHYGLDIRYIREEHIRYSYREEICWLDCGDRPVAWWKWSLFGHWALFALHPYPGYWVMAAGTADGYEGSISFGNVMRGEQYNGAISLDAMCSKIMKCKDKFYWSRD